MIISCQMMRIISVSCLLEKVAHSVIGPLHEYVPNGIYLSSDSDSVHECDRLQTDGPH